MPTSRKKTIEKRMPVVILGAGPAGLAAADELSSYDISCRVIERQREAGGLCRTLNYEGYLFDIGGHRFLSRSTEINAIWKSVLGSDLLECERKSRIFYDGHFYDYPLKPWSALRQMGPVEASRCVLSYAGAQMRPGPGHKTFEDWMTRRFGRRLYENFFKSYTEKVWGIPCEQLSSDWAEQRIQELSLLKAIGRGLRRGSGGIKTLADKFYYPRKGPGQFCDRMQERCSERGVEFVMEAPVREIRHAGGRVVRVETGDGRTFEGADFIATLPLTVLIQNLVPKAPAEILHAASSLKFRSFISVNLIYEKDFIFDDNWIYIHSPDKHVGRIQNYKNWSPEMVPVEGTTSLGMEYFVSEGDNLWCRSDKELVDLAVKEAESLGLVDAAFFRKGFAVRMRHAYPVYEPGYDICVRTLRTYLESFENLQVAGRAGLFRYNNSDHALLTGLFAARNVLGGRHDLWSIDPDYPASGRFEA